ncbi:hypothetical protein SAMN04488054_10870 [Salibacterium qingdaonense]|uniref:Uncharacterized protein n=1 Tax=Salibacterium qingdaonense TaxID=266892 RepID=A0A1I4LNF3_9BACI|nr:hypothetical protein SAMN04488054_10870 [Salibacterium qingdaonense]
MPSAFNYLFKAFFILSGLSMLIFIIILDKNLTGYILFFMFFIVAIILFVIGSKKYKEEKEPPES